MFYSAIHEDKRIKQTKGNKNYSAEDYSKLGGLWHRWIVKLWASHSFSNALYFSS